MHMHATVCIPVMYYHAELLYKKKQKKSKKKKPEGRPLLSGGYQYLRIRKGIDGLEFWRYCLWTFAGYNCEDQLEVVRGEHNHVPNSAKCNTETVHGAIIRKRAREEVEAVPAICMDALYIQS